MTKLYERENKEIRRLYYQAALTRSRPAPLPSNEPNSPNIQHRTDRQDVHRNR